MNLWMSFPRSIIVLSGIFLVQDTGWSYFSFLFLGWLAYLYIWALNICFGLLSCKICHLTVFLCFQKTYIHRNQCEFPRVNVSESIPTIKQSEKGHVVHTVCVFLCSMSFCRWLPFFSSLTKVILPEILWNNLKF